MADKLPTGAMTLIWASTIAAAVVCIRDFINDRRETRLNKAMDSSRWRSFARAGGATGAVSPRGSGGGSPGGGGNSNHQF